MSKFAKILYYLKNNVVKNGLSFYALFTFSVITSSLSNAQAWEAVVNCQGGELVVDREWYEARGQWGVRTQLVLRNHKSIDYFISQGVFGNLNDSTRALATLNEKGELILNNGVDLLKNGDSWPIMTATAWRFNEVESRSNGYAFILLNLKDEGSGNYRLTAVKANPYPSDRPLVADWLFHDCWKNY